MARKVHVKAEGRELGYFKAKFISWGPSFNIFDMQDQEIGSVKGDWKGWNFQLLSPQKLFSCGFTRGEAGANALEEQRLHKACGSGSLLQSICKIVRGLVREVEGMIRE